MKKIVLYYDDVQPVILSLFQKIKNVKDEIIRIYTFNKFYQLNRFSFNYEEIIKARCNCI
jgi:secreted Zn-dependent insulinase-like peptidase